MEKVCSDTLICANFTINKLIIHNIKTERKHAFGTFMFFPKTTTERQLLQIWGVQPLQYKNVVFVFKISFHF